MAVPTIFVIDDQKAVREALGEMLRTFGHHVDIFDSAQAFLDRLAGRQHGCVVADVRMPGMDGIELVRELEVMDLVVEGCTSQAIAARLSISQRTVESYRVQIMEKMQAPSVAVLVRQAVRLSRITP